MLSSSIETLITDMCLAIGSLFFVMIYMAIHTRSCFLSVFGMFHILMSFPLAYCIYNFVLGIESFYTLSAMSVYVILAIGADDVSIQSTQGYLFPYLRLFDARKSTTLTSHIRTVVCGRMSTVNSDFPILFDRSSSLSTPSTNIRT